MKLLLITNNLLVQKDDGLYIEKTTGSFLEGLLQAKWEVGFFQFRDKLPDNDCMATYNLSQIGIKTKTVKRYKFKILSYINAYIAGAKCVYNCDYLYLFYPNTFCYLVIGAILFRKKYGLYVRGEQGANSRISNFMYRYASNIFSVSPLFTEYICKINKNVQTISPMIDIGLDDIETNRNYIYKEKYNLLFLGRLESDKGIFEVIEAVKLLVNSNFHNFKLNVVGDGPDVTKTRNLVTEYKLQEYIEFHGTALSKNVIRDFYLSSDLFILSSYHEGFPRVLYEAMIYGTPILTTFVGTIAHLMKDEYNCYRLKIGSAGSIFETVLSVLSAYSEKALIAKKATVTVHEYLQHYDRSHLDLFLKETAKTLTIA